MDEPSKLEWRGQLQFEERVGDLRLTVIAQPFNRRSLGMRYAGLAIEAPAEADSLSEVLANHSHGDIGDYETIFECIAACEQYIRNWRDSKVGEMARCACADVNLDGATQ